MIPTEIGLISFCIILIFYQILLYNGGNDNDGLV